MALRTQVAKFKFHQYILRANSPNLMLTKFNAHQTFPLYGIVCTTCIVTVIFFWWKGHWVLILEQSYCTLDQGYEINMCNILRMQDL